MTGLHVLVVLFAAYMLVRHVPRTLALLRGEGPRAMGFVSLLNVVLAVAILAVGVRGLAQVLLHR